MTTPPTPTPAAPTSSLGHPAAARPRRAHLILRDGAVLDGRIYLSEGQSLALFLGSRKGGWVNIVDVVWAADGERAQHLVLQTDHLALAASTDGDIPAIVGSSVSAQRWVEIGLENGLRLHGCLFLAERQRLSDYLYTVGKFLPVTRTTRLTDQASLGEVAINCAAIRIVRDIAVPATSEVPPPAVEAAPYSVFVVDDTPVTREAIRTDAASLTLLTPGRFPDRRTTETPVQPARAVPDVVLPAVTAEQQRGAERAARSWLGLMAARHKMVPADPRRLTATPATGDIWRALCAANEMIEEELAAIVAVECKLGVAVFESIEAKAVAQIPGKVARRLGVLPLHEDGRVLHVATCDPFDPDIDTQLRFVTKMRVEFEIAPPTLLAHALEWWYPSQGGE